jgi:hypothetical protein
VVGGGQPAGQQRALREPPGPASRPACTGRAKVVTRYPKTPAAERVHDARASPHRYCWLATAHTLGRRNGMHIPSSRPAQAGVRPTLKSTLQRSAPHPARGAVQQLADPVWALPSGDMFAAAGEPKQMHSLPMLSLPSWCARAEQVPANPVRAARLRPALCAHSVRRLPGAPAGRTSTRLGAGSPPPLSAEGTLQAEAAACGLPAGMRTPAVTSAFARREHSYRARRTAGSAEVDDQAECPMAEPGLLPPRSNANHNWTWRSEASGERKTAPKPACLPNVRARPALTGSLLAWT